jgi:hypothetical protein
MMRMIVAMTVLIAFAGARLAEAAEHPPAAPHSTAPAHAAGHSEAHAESHALSYDHPAVSPPAPWAGATVIVILGMFLLAAAVGVGVRMNTPEDVPESHSHDDAHGASHDAHHHH